MLAPTFAALLLAATLHSQTVEGFVTNDIGHEPIAGATVVIQQSSDRGLRVQTDERGAFRLSGVAPGDHLVYVSREGFEMATAGVQIHIEPAADLPSMRLSMVPWPGLNGRVLDPDGKPVAQAPVQAISFNSLHHTATLTDADGRFHFEGVTPGEYTILAHPLADADPTDASQTAPTYFPNATDLSAATRIQARAGADLSGFEIHLRALPVFRVSGKVLDETGEPAAGATLQVNSANVRSAKATAGEDGAFEFDKVRAGKWRIALEFHRGETSLRGSAPIDVNGRDLERLRLRVSPPLPLSGGVELDGRPIDFKGKVFLEPAAGEGVRPSAIIDGSRFRFEDAYPGRYTLFVMPAIDGAYLDAVLLGDRDVSLQEFELVEGIPPFRVVLRSGGGTVRLNVADKMRCMAFLVPGEERLQGFPFISAAPCIGGHVQFDHVRPGEYYALVVDPADLPFLQDIHRARARIATAPTVKVEQLSVVSIDLH